MSRRDDPIAWVDLAEQDYKTAQLVLARSKPFYRIVCFHAQQSAEKYLKSLLVERKSDFPKTHDLVRIKSLCEDAAFLIPVSQELLQSLTMYAAEVRYPGISVSRQDAEEALATARAVRRFVRKLFGLH